MDQREQQLLDKQLWWLSPSPRNDNVLAVVVAAFVTGITLGGALFAVIL